MFENLTKREKVLAGATAGAFVIALIFGGFFWVLGKFNANEEQLRSVALQIEREEARTRQALAATRRKSWYVGTSLTSDIDDAKNQYIDWLKKTLRDDLGVNLPRGVDLERTSELSHEGVKVADQISFSIRPQMKLSQLVRFLDQFYSIDTLHRISSFKLTPDTQTVGGKKVRTGELKTSFQIQVLCLTAAGKKTQFGETFRDSGLTVDQAQESIVRRDIFGPENNSPVLKVSTRSSYETGKDQSIQLTATDADDDDLLSIELVSGDIAEATFQHVAGQRDATLMIPGQPVGSYSFVFKVTDNGLPARATEKKATVRFKDKPAPRVVKPKPKAPRVKMAEETRITGNLRNREGQWVVLIKSQMDGKSFRLTEGETFELDGEDWKVVSIDESSAKLLVAGEELTFNRGENFTKHLSQEHVRE